jgi:UDP-N-acetyl-D-mannosaminuronate dehydrogenase
MNVGILGLGEVGSAIKEVYTKAEVKYDVFTKDLDHDNFPASLNLLNVCIPYTSRDSFIDVVDKVAGKHRPHWVIIHSTVGVGTTSELSRVLCIPCVHSPVRGIHPNIYTGLKTFPKFYGATDLEGGSLTSRHFNSLWLEPWDVGCPETSETLKLWDTTVYGVNIALGKHIKAFCEEHGDDYNMVMNIAAKTYNKGFESMGNDTYRRYAIKDSPGKIGGHCVIPNAKILKEENQDSFAEMLLKLNNGY